MGKQFTAVDMEEKIGEAISPEEFSRVKTGTVEEIVYEMKDDERPGNSIYTYTNRNVGQRVMAPYASQASLPQVRMETMRMSQGMQAMVSPRSVIERNPVNEPRNSVLPTASSR